MTDLPSIKTKSGELVPPDCVSPPGKSYTVKGRRAQNLERAYRSKNGWQTAERKSMCRACKGKSLGHPRVLVESSLASSDTLIPSTRKDADDTQELKLKIYEVAGHRSRRPRRWHKLAKLSLVLTFS